MIEVSLGGGGSVRGVVDPVWLRARINKDYDYKPATLRCVLNFLLKPSSTVPRITRPSEHLASSWSMVKSSRVNIPRYCAGNLVIRGITSKVYI